MSSGVVSSVSRLASRSARKDAPLPAEQRIGRSIVYFLVPDFTMLTFAAALDPLRFANRMLGYEAYTWRLASLDGQSVRASNGVQCAVDTSLAQERRKIVGFDRPSMTIICSGANVEKFSNRSAFAWLRELYSRSVAVGGLGTGAYVLALAGLLSNKRCTIHWENLPSFVESFPQASAVASLFEVDQNVYTCAGGTAALDMMLSIIARDFDETLVKRICEQMLTDRVRSSSDRQTVPLRARLRVHNAKIVSIVEMMEGNLSEPLSLDGIASKIGVSRRQIERLFRQHLGCSPAKYYLEMRLEWARHLLVQTLMPIIEIAIACGFVSASHFSKCYRGVYAHSPQEERTSKGEHRGPLCAAA